MIAHGSTAPLKRDEILSRVETYLNSFSILKALIKQHNRDGSTYGGEIVLKRGKETMQGKALVQYEADIGQRILVRDGQLTMMDKDGSQNSGDVEQSPFVFMLKSTIKLSDYHIKEAEESSDHKNVLVTLAQKTDPDGMAITLIFARDAEGKIQEFVMWEVLDAESKKTTVEIVKTMLIGQDLNVLPDTMFTLDKISG